MATSGTALLFEKIITGDERDGLIKILTIINNTEGVCIVAASSTVDHQLAFGEIFCVQNELKIKINIRLN